MTVKVVLAAGASVVAPSAPKVKSPGCEPFLVRASPVRAAVPVFLMVNVFAALVENRFCLPKPMVAVPSTRSAPAGCSTAISGLAAWVASVWKKMASHASANAPGWRDRRNAVNEVSFISI